MIRSSSAVFLLLQGACAFLTPAGSVRRVPSPLPLPLPPYLSDGIIQPSNLLPMPRSTSSSYSSCYGFRRRRQESSSSTTFASENACTINDSHHREDHRHSSSSSSSSSGISRSNRGGWRRRVLSRLGRGRRSIINNQERSGRRTSSSSSLLTSTSVESTATADDIEGTTAVVSAVSAVNAKLKVDDFILENFDRLSPEQLFSTLERSQYTLEIFGSEADKTGTTEVVDSQHHGGPFFEPPLELPVVLEEEKEKEEKELELEELQYSTTTRCSLFTNETTKAAAAAAAELAAFAASYENEQWERDEDEQLLLDCAMPISLIGSTSSFEGGPPGRKMVRNWFQNLLKNCFRNWATEEPVNLYVRCSPTGNALGQILRGELRCNARAEFDRLVLDFLRLQKGTIEGSRLALNLLAFTVDRSQQGGFDNNHYSTNNVHHMHSNDRNNQDEETNSRKKNKEEKEDYKHKMAASSKPSANRSSERAKVKPRRRRLLEAKKMLPRYQTAFDLHAHDCIFSQEDLFESSCVRNGLQNLVKRILKQKGILTKSVLITDISILERSDKVSISGEASVMHGPTLGFEVRSGIGFKNRGHVVTFPGLELAVSRSRTNKNKHNNTNTNNNMFMPMGRGIELLIPLPNNIELDIGHNARLRECTLDGKKKQIKVSASVTITPQHTLKLSDEYTQSSRSYSAQFSCDLGRWLTRIGRFSL